MRADAASKQTQCWSTAMHISNHSPLGSDLKRFSSSDFLKWSPLTADCCVLTAPEPTGLVKWTSVLLSSRSLIVWAKSALPQQHHDDIWGSGVRTPRNSFLREFLIHSRRVSITAKCLQRTVGSRRRPVSCCWERLHRHKKEPQDR